MKNFESPSQFDLEQSTNQNRIKKHLQEILNLNKEAVERIALLKAKDLPQQYQAQCEFLNDKRLDGVTIAVVPDDLWIKGNQPSESSADMQLIKIRQSYFETQGNPDQIAWLCHELAHCQNFLDSDSPESYQDKMNKFAFADVARYMNIPKKDMEQELNQVKSHGANENEIARLKELLGSTSENLIQVPVYYPNNPVEQFTFTRQFQFLKDQGKKKEEVFAMIRNYYGEEDFPFFNRLLDSVYEK